MTSRRSYTQILFSNSHTCSKSANYLLGCCGYEKSSNAGRMPLFVFTGCEKLESPELAKGHRSHGMHGMVSSLKHWSEVLKIVQYTWRSKEQKNLGFSFLGAWDLEAVWDTCQIQWKPKSSYWTIDCVGALIIFEKARAWGFCWSRGLWDIRDIGWRASGG
jgi:hypothetical protein